MRLQHRSILTLSPFDRAPACAPTHRRPRAPAPRAHGTGPEPSPQASTPQAPALTPPQTSVGPVPAPLAPPAHATEVDGTLAEGVGQAAMQVILHRGAPNLSEAQLRRALPLVVASARGVDLPALRANIIETWRGLHASHRTPQERPKYQQAFRDGAARYMALIQHTLEGATLQSTAPLWEPWLAGCSAARLQEVLAEATVLQREQSTPTL